MKPQESLPEQPFSHTFFEDPAKYAKILQRIAQDPDSGLTADDIEGMLSQPISACQSWEAHERGKWEKEFQAGTERVGEKLRLLLSSFTGGNQELHDALKALSEEMQLHLLPVQGAAVNSKEKVPDPHFDWVSPNDEKYKIAYHSQAIVVYSQGLNGQWIQAPLIRE